MISIIEQNCRKLGDNGKAAYVCELYADTAAELEGVTEFGGQTILPGSKALTADGYACIFDSSGVWHSFKFGSEEA